MADRLSREDLARRGGRRLDEDGAQLGFFEEDGTPVASTAPVRGPGRPQGAGNRAKSRIRDYLAAKGYRDPAEQLALLAGLDQREVHPIYHAAKLAQAIGVPVDVVLREMRQAADALLPYWHAKLTPDVLVNLPPVPILMQVNGAVQVDAGALGGHRFAPADVRAALPEGQVSAIEDIAPAGDEGQDCP